VCGRVPGLHLSALGRGMAVSGYALSRVLHRAEFDTPPTDTLEQLQHAAAQVTDQDRPAAAGAPRHPGVPHTLLPGRLRTGGFGLLPLVHHVTARHAAWALRLLHYLHAPVHVLGGPQQPPSPPWLALASLLLRRICPALHPVQTLLLSTLCTPAQVAQGLLPTPHQACLIPAGPLLRMAAALRALGALSWAPGAGPPGVSVSAWLCTPLPAPTVCQLVPQLLWPPNPVFAARPVPLSPCASPVTVSALTTYLMRGVEQARWQLVQHYLQQALPPLNQPAQLPAAGRALRRTLSQVLRLPWENTHKALLWRLLVNGVPGAGGGGWCRDQPCPCGHLASPQQRQQHGSAVHRQHTFWDCPTTAGIRAVLLATAGVPVQQQHVWLLQPPTPAVQRVVWQVVCLAALEAMEHGRRQLWRLAHGTDPPVPAELAVPAASQLATARFTDLLQDFAAARSPVGWKGWGAVGPEHAFLRVQLSHPPLAPQLLVNLQPV
jgi:hypothetical protein